MDEIEQRLRETTEACIRNFETWVKEKKSLESREALMETMHEVRKVLSRVEIEIAISERDRLGSRPIPIPPHRSSRKRSENDEGGEYGDFDNADHQEPAAQPVGEPRRQGRGRRPMPNRGERAGNHDKSDRNNSPGGGNGAE